MSTSPPIVPALSQGGTINGNLTVTGEILATDNIQSTAGEVIAATFAGADAYYTFTHYLSDGGAVTAAAGAGAGTSPPAPVVDAGSYDAGGRITWGTGTSPAAGIQVAVTFAAAYTSQIPGVTVSPLNAATEALGLYVVPSLTGFSVSTVSAPTASEPNTTYGFNFTVLGSDG